jgi:hypothetical protein
VAVVLQLCNVIVFSTSSSKLNTMSQVPPYAKLQELMLYCHGPDEAKYMFGSTPKPFVMHSSPVNPLQQHGGSPQQQFSLKAIPPFL